MRAAMAAIGLIALSPMAAGAQTPATTGTVLPPVDPARVAAAKPVIDQIWPLGTYARLMHATMDQAVNGMLASMYDMTPAQLSVDAKVSPAVAQQSLRQRAKEQDPASDERMRITMRVMTDGIADLMTQVEPEVRQAMAQAYARRFTVTQLDDLHRFFDTPTGRTYASESMMLMASPDMMKAMQAFVPKMIQAMPAIMAKVQDATKHLPPVKKKGASQ